MATRYLVCIPHYYGKGDTIDLAFKQIAKISGSRKRSKRIVFQFDTGTTPECYINETGNLCWVGVKPVEIERTT